MGVRKGRLNWGEYLEVVCQRRWRLMFVYRDSLKCTVADYEDALASFLDTAVAMPTLYVGDFNWVTWQPAAGVPLPVALSHCSSAPASTSAFSR